jgi:hypothetical protein
MDILSTVKSNWGGRRTLIPSYYTCTVVICLVLSSCVGPVDGGGKTPLVNGFSLWKTAPGVVSVSKEISTDGAAVIPSRVVGIAVVGPVIFATRQDTDHRLRYWILDTLKNQVTGDLTEEESIEIAVRMGLDNEITYAPAE